MQNDLWFDRTKCTILISSYTTTCSLLTAHLEWPANCWLLIYNDLLTANSSSKMTYSQLTPHLQWPAHCWQLIYNHMLTADSSSTITWSLLTAHLRWPSLLTAHLQSPAHCWQLIYNDLFTADSSSTMTWSLLTAHLRWPAHCWRVIFTHLKLWVAVARHNFKWVKIYNDLLTAGSSCKMTCDLTEPSALSCSAHLQWPVHCWQLI